MKKFTEEITKNSIFTKLYNEIPENLYQQLDDAMRHLYDKSALALCFIIHEIIKHDKYNEYEENIKYILNQLISSKTGFVEHFTHILNDTDKEGKFNDLKDDKDDDIFWWIYQTYLAKTIAKEDQLKELEDLNKFLRSFKYSWPIDWEIVETRVKNLHAGNYEALQQINTKDNKEITNLEQDTAIEDAFKEEKEMITSLAKKAGIDEKKLKDYVNLIITKSFKDINTDSNEPVVVWKKKIAKGEPTDNDFILGISAIVCGAIITGDKSTIKDIFNYLDSKTQDDLKQAKNKLFK